MDSASTEVSNRILRLFAENRALAVVCPGHTTTVFQALSLPLFGALKNWKATAVGQFKDESVNEPITRMAQAYEPSAHRGRSEHHFEELD
jgi:hypothetical protein